jgi:hypothetical protein
MNHRPKRRTPGWVTRAARAAIALLFVLAIYVLSVGPAIWLSRRNNPPEDVGAWLAFPYAPLDWLAHKSPSAARVLFWYASFWE